MKNKRATKNKYHDGDSHSTSDENETSKSIKSLQEEEELHSESESGDSGSEVGGNDESGDGDKKLKKLSNGRVDKKLINAETKLGWGTKVNSKNKTRAKGLKAENELTHLIPGYTAPMRLEAKSLKGRTGLSLSQLRNQAAKNDASIVTSSISILNRQEEAFDPAAAAKKVKTPSSIAIQKSAGLGGKIPTSFSSSFRKTARKQHDPTAGSGWFGMTPTPMSDQLKTDLAIIRNRNYLDPKKFYKSADSFAGKVLQVGTVIEGNSEYYSSRLAKRERRQNLTEEVMASSEISNYAKRKYHDLQMEKQKKGVRRPTKRGKKRR